MLLATRTLMTCALLLLTLQAVAQPVTKNEGAEAWWGAGVWILITLVLLVGMVLFLVKGIKRPNR